VPSAKCINQQKTFLATIGVVIFAACARSVSRSLKCDTFLCLTSGNQKLQAADPHGLKPSPHPPATSQASAPQHQQSPLTSNRALLPPSESLCPKEPLHTRLEMQHLLDKFNKVTKLVLKPRRESIGEIGVPIGILLSRAVDDFVGWYVEVTGESAVSELVFCVRKEEKGSPTPALTVKTGDIPGWRLLNECIWYFFQDRVRQDPELNNFVIDVTVYLPNIAEDKTQHANYHPPGSIEGAPFHQVSTSTSSILPTGQLQALSAELRMIGSLPDQNQPGSSTPAIQYNISEPSPTTLTPKDRSSGTRPRSPNHPSQDSTPSNIPPPTQMEASHGQQKTQSPQNLEVHGISPDTECQDVDLLNFDFPTSTAAETDDMNFSFKDIFRNLDGSLLEKGTQLDFAKMAKQNLENVLVTYKALAESDKSLFLEHLQDQVKQKAASNSSDEPEITFRLQKDGRGMFGEVHDKNELHPKVMSSDFFAWFAGQTKYGGGSGPEELKFTFKDGLPNRMMKVIARGDDEHLRGLRKDIKEEFRKAKGLLPGMGEFVVLVTAPGWGAEVVEDADEEW